MLHGKKGFDRIVYAFKNVLQSPVTWLFHDLTMGASGSDILASHFPSAKVCNPMVIENFTCDVPNFRAPTDNIPANDGDFEDYSVDMYEWLALMLLQSPRTFKDDRIDPLLSRCRAPGISVTSSGLVKVTWQGFLSPMWAHKTFVEMLLTLPSDEVARY
ncbi:ribonuclease P 40kDa subunit [Glarea lozoyensis ATCC 20868]|uniref:Ribonuclease P 40kDa subunit n=1 Tax=Glarea lozoyensis (strain ATCC 20868 / MF5171) TaxID=1116229 RepID=S3CJ42_GLAL2|nr:ribonuclease P 40kDa subunit [Glarea lozoyensis ATCC 20868]EPE25249.1 ribonuclease P 40kDa subunit [Glarea lozoyensis ATCC 20868]